MNDSYILWLFEQAKSRAKILKLKISVMGSRMKVEYNKTKIFETQSVQDLHTFVLGFQAGMNHEKI